MTQFHRLFQPGRIGTVELRNRIVMSPMGTFSGDPEGYITDRTIDYYVARARGGIGLIIVGGVSIMREARAPLRLWLFEDKFIPRLRQLTEAVHRHGAKIALQLLHQGRALAELLPLFDDPAEAAGIDVVAPSPQTSPSAGRPARQLAKEDIARIVEAFAEGARRTREAGFDAVEFHGGHSYLISDFRSGFTNHRTDEYGGCSENRARLACEVLRRARQKVGPDFPISLRISACDFLPGGITLEDTLCEAPLFIEAGADVLDVSASAKETAEWQHPTYFSPDGPLVHLAEAVKKVVNVPVITVGKLSDPSVAERVLEEGKADYVAVGRGLLADPELPNKAREGRPDDICECIYCNNCLNRTYQEFKEFGGLFCTVNPSLFREREFAPKPAASPKKVMVVGGGLAGMQAATDLAQRGHHVSLYERGERLGGQWNVACQVPAKSGFATVTRRLTRDMQKAGVRLALKTTVTRQVVRQARPDVVVVATGGVPRTPNIRGDDGQNVVQAVDVVTGRARVGDRVVVVGGRLMGMEAADYLAERGKEVSIVTLRRLGENGRKLNGNIYRVMRDRLIRHHVAIFANSPVIEISTGGVWANENGNLLFLPADTVVLAVGVQADRQVAEDLKGIATELHIVGDCLEPRDALAALRDGAEVARRI